MVDVTFLSPQKNQCILTTHTEVLSRADRKTGVVNGNRVIPTDPVSLAVTVEAGRIRILGAPSNATQSNVSLSSANPTLHRIDIIYRDTSGIPQVIAGTPDAIEDPKNLGDWKGYTAPTPPSTIPDGVILAAVWVPAAATTISSGNIWMFAGGVEDISTFVGSPGSDAYPSSEKAVRTLADSKISASDIVTTVGNPGSENKVPAESAVRTLAGTLAPAAKGVTGGDGHDHIGGDGAQIDHGGLSGLTDDDHAQYYNTARGDARWAPVAKGVTGGDAHDSLHSSAFAALSHASRHKSGGADSIRIDELAAPTDVTTHNASTSAHGFMQKYPGTKQRLKGDGGWADPYFTAPFQFGDGQSVILAQAKTKQIPIASRIIAARIRSIDNAAALKSGSITCTVYVHDYNAGIGTAVDSFALSSASSYSETGLNISVGVDQFISVVVSGITDVTNVSLNLKLEAT